MNRLAAILFVISGLLLAMLARVTFGSSVPGLVYGPLLAAIPAAICAATRRLHGAASIAMWLHCGWAGVIAFLGASPFVVSASVGLVFLAWHNERLDRVLGKADGPGRRMIFARVIAWEIGVLAIGLALAGLALVGRVSLPFLPTIGTAMVAVLLLAAGIRRSASRQ